MTNITEFDLFYLSYDEPQKEKFWSLLNKQCPWSKRIDGVKGFDNAHKACAESSETPWFITIDGDNTVENSFFDTTVDIQDDVLCYSWRARNSTNGLVYGNGGIKLWNKQHVLDMRTHENAQDDDEKNAVDFCWQGKYVQLNNLYSHTHINGSPFQSFRAGFREGIKLSLDQGEVLSPYEFKSKVYPLNYKRLCVWASVGNDVKHGLWSIYGTRLAIKMLIMDKWNHHQIRDYDWFENFWLHQKTINLVEENQQLLVKLKEVMNLEIDTLSEDASKFFKAVYINPIHMNSMQKED